MAGYTRQSEAGIVDGAAVSASDLNAEFNQLESAMDQGSGHSHDGTAGNAPKITNSGLANNAVATATIQDDAVTGDKIDSVTTITAASFVGNLDADSATIDSLTITSGTAVTSIDTDLSTVSNSDDTLASAKAIKAYVDAQVDTADQLTELTDVIITSVADNEVLAYNNATSKWINQTATEAGLQPNDAGLTSIAGLTTAADKMIYTTGSDTYATTGLTQAGRAILDDANASAQRTTLGLAIGTDVQAYDAGLNSIAGLTTAADKMIYTTAADTYATTSLSSFGRTLIDDANASAARTTLGLGTAATTASTDYATSAQGTTADNALPKAGGTMTGDITFNSTQTFDGRDLSADGTKLDGIEANATADQTATEIKTAYESNLDTNAFTDAEQTKLSGIEAGADVTDETNVTAAGALMDSEVTNLAQVKAFSSADYATAAQGTTADSALQPSDNISELTNDSGYITGNQTITLSGDATGSGTTAITVALAANTVGVSELNLTDGTAGQFLKTDGAGTISFADAPTQATSFTVLDVDNINIDGNTISSTDTNGDIVLTPNGSGDVELRSGGNTNIELQSYAYQPGPTYTTVGKSFYLKHFSENSAGSKTPLGQLDWRYQDVTAGSESSSFNLFNRKNGSTQLLLSSSVTTNYDLACSTNLLLYKKLITSGFEPTLRYDTDGSGSLNISDYNQYYAYDIGATAKTSIEDGMVLDAPWSGDSSATNDNCRFGLSIAQGNLDDLASAIVSGTPKGHGDAIVFGNIQHNSDGTAELINGIAINGDAIDIGSSETGATTHVNGALSKSSGSFRIDHPLSSKESTHYLVHSFVEAPQADNIYRGKVDLVNGSASVNIDTVAGMTDGTFVALNRDIQCFTSNESDWDAVKGSISGNILTISCENTSSTATISWLVVGERKDQHMYDTKWTDENGKVIVEPTKDS